MGAHALARDAAGGVRSVENRRVLSKEGLDAILTSVRHFRVGRQWNGKSDRARTARERSRRTTPSFSTAGFSVISIVVGLVF
jgi:hypothetical protein